MPVAEDLDLDVPRLLDELLDVDVGIAEPLFGLVLGGLEGVLEFRLLADDPHPAPAAAGHGLDDDGKADRLWRSRCLPAISFTTPSLPGTTGTPALRIVSFARALSPMAVIISGLGPMNLIPLVVQISAKLAFSARNPYPGWIASALVISAAAMMRGILR